MPTPPSLEQEIKDFFAQHRVDYDDRSRSFTRLDFGYGDEFTNRYFAFDAKEKRQRYNPRNWPTDIPEAHLFIIDDLAARKILIHAPNAGLLVRDTSQETPAYYFYSVVDLFLMPKQRVNRTIRSQRKSTGAEEAEELKGKWLIDLRNAHASPDLRGAFVHIKHYLDQREAIFHEILACHGDFVGEEIGSGGITRQGKHWQVDVSETR